MEKLTVRILKGILYVIILSVGGYSLYWGAFLEANLTRQEGYFTTVYVMLIIFGILIIVATAVKLIVESVKYVTEKKRWTK